MEKVWKTIVQDESGQGIVEYGLIIAAIAIAAIAAVWAFGDDIVNFFNGLSFEKPAAS